MENKIVYLAFIFLIYSFLGWVIESLILSIINKRFINRGVLTGPFVITYGVAAILLSIAFFDTTSIPLIFIGSLIYTTFIQLTAGKILTAFKLGRWWDYSHIKFNLEGLICLQGSLAWALLSTIGLLVLNPLLHNLFIQFDYSIIKIVLIVILILLIVDFIISYLSLTKKNANKVINSKSSSSISNDVIKRISLAYPTIKSKKVFSEDTFNIYKFFIYLGFGGFLGCMCEMVFCRITMGIWMSRSSLLYGEISLVWGLAFALFTTYLHMYRKQSSLFVFIYGLVLGTAFEYLCGSFCEYLYGYSFWDYNHLPLNINGRVQIVFVIIWGFSALIYIKFVYKFINSLIIKIPEKIGKTIISILIIVLLLDISISVFAGIRFSERHKGYPPSNYLDELCDKYYTDEYLQRRFKTLKIME